jgi:acyl carrier protein
MAPSAAAVEAAIRAALKDVRPEAAAIAGSAELAREAGLDSMQVMNLVMEIEERLDISIPVELLADVHTLDQLCAGIVRLADGSTREPA